MSAENLLSDEYYERVFIEYKNPKSSDRLSANPDIENAFAPLMETY